MHKRAKNKIFFTLLKFGGGVFGKKKKKGFEKSGGRYGDIYFVALIIQSYGINIH